PEEPGRWGGLVDLPETPDGRTGTRLAAVLAGTSGEDQVAIRASGTFARRLARAPLADTAPPRSWRPRGTVLVTGGTGALGAEVARWLAGGGAEHLVLTSRRGPDAPGAVELRDELADRGGAGTVAACDGADREVLRGLLDGLPEPPSAVVHAAGTSEGGRIGDSTPADLAEAMAAKVAGATHLDTLLEGTP